MADNKTPISSPAQSDVDSLLSSGAITPETAELLRQKTPEYTLPATPADQALTEEAQQLSPEINSSMSDDALEAEAEKLAAEQQVASLEAETASNQPAVKIAEDIVAENAEKQQRAEAIKDAVDVKEQTEQNKEMLKSQLAQEDAIQQVAIEDEQDRQDEINQIQAEINREQEELKSFSMEDIFDQEDAPISKTRAVLAMIIGGIGAGLGGGPNLGVQAVNKTMDDYFNKKKLGMRERLAKKQRVFDLMKLQLEEQRQATDNEIKQAKIAQLQAQMEAGKMQAAQQQADIIARQKAMQKLRSGKLSQDEERLMVESLSKEDKKRYIPGFGLAKDAETAKNVSKQLDSGEQAIKQVQTIRNLLQEFGTREVFNRGAVASEESARRGLQLQLKELFNLGVLNGPDLDLLNEYTGEDFFAVTTSDANKYAKLKAVENFVTNRINAALSTSGLPALGKSKADAYIDHFMKKGLSQTEAADRYRKLLESGKIKP